MMWRNPLEQSSILRVALVALPLVAMWFGVKWAL